MRRTLSRRVCSVRWLDPALLNGGGPSGTDAAWGRCHASRVFLAAPYQGWYACRVSMPRSSLGCGYRGHVGTEVMPSVGLGTKVMWVPRSCRRWGWVPRSHVGRWGWVPRSCGYRGHAVGGVGYHGHVGTEVMPSVGLEGHVGTEVMPSVGLG